MSLLKLSFLNGGPLDRFCMQSPHVVQRTGVHLCPQVFKTLHLLHTQTMDLQVLKQV